MRIKALPSVQTAAAMLQQRPDHMYPQEITVWFSNTAAAIAERSLRSISSLKQKKRFMKKTITVLLLIFLSLCLFGCSSNKTDSEPAGGDISQDNTTTEDNVETEEEWLCVKETYYLSDGVIDTYCIYNYDGDGKFISMQEYDKDNNLVSSGESQYDEKGREVLYQLYDENGLLDYSSEYEYDENDLLIKESDYYSDGTPADYYVYEYDERGNMTRMENTTEDGFLSYSSEIEYDEKDRQTKAHYTFYGYDDWTNVYEYEGEKLVKLTMYNSNGEIDKTAVYSYNGANPELADSMIYYDSDNNLMYRYEYRYDEAGNEISEALFDGQDKMTSMIECEYKKK